MQRLFFILFLVSILFVSSASTQEKSCKKGHCLKGDVGYFSFSIGPSFPLGNFGDKNLSNPYAGFANTGSKIELNGGYGLLKSVNLNVRVLYSVNNYDFNNLINKLSVDYPATTWSSTGRSWDIFGGMIGVSYSYPLTNKFTGDFKFLSGFIKTSAPAMEVTGSNGAKITENEKSATSFAYSISVGGYYPLGRLIDFVGSLEYISSSPSFNNINKTSNFPANNVNGTETNTSTNSFKQNINLFALNFGIRVKF